MGKLYTSIGSVRGKCTILKRPEFVRQLLLITLGQNKLHSHYLSGLPTMLDLGSYSVCELHWTVQPVDCAYEGSFRREFKLPRQAYFNLKQAFSRSCGQRLCRDMKLQPMILPVEGLALVGDKDACRLSSDI